MHIAMAMALLFAEVMPVGVAVRRALETHAGLRAAGVRVQESDAAARAARGVLDLRLTAELGLSKQRFTGTSLGGGRKADEKSGGLFSIAAIQPLVWGTQVQLGWTNELTRTDNPFLNCIPGLDSDQCLESRLELMITQPLWRGAGRDVVENPEAQAKAAGAVAERQRRAQAAAVAQAAVLAYVELAYARADRAIRAQALALARQQEAATRARIEAGQLAAVDLPVVEQAVAERESALFHAEQASSDRAAALAVALGLDDAPEVALPPLAPWTQTEAAAREDALGHHPDLAVLAAEIRRERVALIPLEDAADPRVDLSLTAAQAGRDQSLSGALTNMPDNENHYYGLRLVFGFPPANRAAEGERSRGRLALHRAELELEDRQVGVGREVGEAWRAVRTAEQGQRLAEHLADMAERTLDAERKKFELGKSTNLDVLEVQQRYSEALLAIERARADRLAAVTRLRQLTGALLEAYGLELESAQ